MTETVANKLSKLMEAVRVLPAEIPEAPADALVDRPADFTDAILWNAQRAEVDRRPANPRYVDSARVGEFLARCAVAGG